MKVLLVEDDPTVVSALKRGLSQEGFTIDVATNGDDGWWMATESSYDAIVLDVLLPGRNGFEVCRQLRGADDWTPVVMLTALDDDTDVVRGIDSGADDYVTKPFSYPVLVAKLRALMRRSARTSPTTLETAQVRIDPVGRRVWVTDAELELTAREFDILLFLVQRVDRVVSKDEILAGVWEFDFAGDNNIVEVYVGRLRRKLRTAAGDELIRTVRGVGYSLPGDARRH